MNTAFLKFAATTAVNPDDDWGVVATTVIVGLVVVFFILAILVLILWVMGKILGGEKKKKAAKEPAAAAVQAVAPAVQTEPEAEAEDDGELIAVISAAVAAYGETEGKQYRVVGVSKKEKALRSSWGLAGISENTRPF